MICYILSNTNEKLHFLDKQNYRETTSI